MCHHHLFCSHLWSAAIYGCGALVSIICTHHFNCLLFVLICKSIVHVNILVFFSFKVWYLCYKVSVDKVDQVFTIGVINIMGIIQAYNQCACGNPRY